MEPLSVLYENQLWRVLFGREKSNKKLQEDLKIENDETDKLKR